MMKLLLVENQPHVAAHVESALRAADDPRLELTLIDDVADAIDHVEAHRPDVVLLGTTLPETVLLEIVSWMRASAPAATVVVLMQTTDDNFFIKAIRNGAQDYLLVRDIDATSLRRTLRVAIERRRSELQRGQAALHESELRLRTVTDNIPALIAYVGTDQRYRFVNQFHEEWFGQRVPELTGKTMLEVLGADDYENCQRYIEQALNGRRVTFEQCMIRNTFERFLQITYIPEYDSAKQVIGFYVLGNNITERKLNEARLESIALYDPLTGLANRVLLADRVSQGIAHARRHTSLTGLIYLDLDEFKQVNDSMGHDVGDLLLREVAERLAVSVRQEDTVARLGGDEFVVAMWRVTGPDDAANVAAKLISIVSQPYYIGGQTLSITTSAGVSLYPAQGEDMETLLKSADLAMYEAKRSGKNSYRIFQRPPRALVA